MKYSSIYFDEVNQKVRYTKDLKKTKNKYIYIGDATRVEFDLLIELLWYKYEDEIIPLLEFKAVFDELRIFCDKIKNNYNI